MRKHLLPILTATSALLCLLCCALSIRGVSHNDAVSLSRYLLPASPTDARPYSRSFALLLGRGGIQFQHRSSITQDPFWADRAKKLSPKGWHLTTSSYPDPIYPSVGGQFSHLGFQWHRIDRESSFESTHSQHLTLPLPFLAILFALLPAIRLITFLRSRHTDPTARPCPHCGYDLRASPTTCPECGNLNTNHSP